VRTSPERREQLLDEFEKSGLSEAAKFAEVVGVTRMHSFGSSVSQNRLICRGSRDAVGKPCRASEQKLTKAM
jgi:hypothetical protein